MSLLLDALKKAERAKEEGQRQAKGVDLREPRRSDEPSAQAPARRVVTRAELPDISQPLEILTEDLGAHPSATKSSGSALALEPEITSQDAQRPEFAAQRAPAPSTASDSPPQGRASERYESIFRESNPRLPYHVSLGVLGVFALCIVVYFWYQLRPATPYVNINPVRPAAEKTVESAQLKPAATTAASGVQGAGGQAPIPGLPATVESTPAAPGNQGRPADRVADPVASISESATPARRNQTVRKPLQSAQAKGPVTRATSVPARDTPDALTARRGTLQIHPRVQAGYTSYEAGDLSTARAEYHQALREEPGNRDALLGLAAVEMRAGRFEQSETYYQRLLQADPRDPHAQAGLLALRSRLADPVQTESRVKSLLADDPEATVLYFTLGNQYAQQSRWAEAQQAYFKAFAADPENPDFAFNLAVSFDQLHQPRLALEYYRRALAFAGKRRANFAVEAVRERVERLSR